MFFDVYMIVRGITFLPFLLAFSINAQSHLGNNFGASVGIVANVGTHVTGVGLNINTYYTDYFYQFNVGTTLYLNERSFGGRKRFFESRSSVGAVILFGKKEMPIDFQLNGLNHQTPYNYGVGYNYVLYHDNAGTSQLSGGMAIHVKNVSIYHENDMFGGQAKDRFRTAHILFTYRNKDLKLGTGVNLWTGETGNSKWQRISLDKCPNGFRALDDLPYGRTSHGIAYGAVWLNGPYGQIPHLKVGYDSEQIRHAVQNRLIHDLIFLPKKIERNTPHYPRLDESGCPVFEYEEVRNGKLFLQLGMNDVWSD